LTFLTAI